MLRTRPPAQRRLLLVCCGAAFLAGSLFSYAILNQGRSSPAWKEATTAGTDLFQTETGPVIRKTDEAGEVVPRKKLLAIVGVQVIERLASITQVKRYGRRCCRKGFIPNQCSDKAHLGDKLFVR